MADDTRVYLDALLAGKPPDLWYYLWTLQDKRSHWFRDAADAPAFLAAHQDQDCYLGLGWATTAGVPHRRLKSADVAALPGVWLDVDVGQAGHKKGNLPPDLESATGLLAAVPLAPTLIVHTGGGLHAYWLFDQPWRLDDAGRAAAARLVEQWQKPFRALARQAGWDVDATHDLARVLRVPGTLNHKHTPPVLARIAVYDPAARYALDAIHAAAPGETQPRPPRPDTGPRTDNGKHGDCPRLRIDPQVQPNLDKLEALLENDPKFVKTWKRQRSDLADQSRSAYDLALANAVARAGWTDQEIVDLLIAWRRKHGEEIKREPDYYARTIATCRASIRQQDEQNQAAQDAEAFFAEYDRSEPMTDARRAQILRVLSAVLHTAISRIIRYRLETPLYRLQTPCGNITLGSVAHLIEQVRLRHHVAEATGVCIPAFKAPRWQSIAQMLLDVCEDEAIDEAQDGERVKAWIFDYLNTHPVDTDVVAAMQNKQPFTKDGGTYFFLADFSKWLSYTIPPLDHLDQGLAPMLHIAGVAPKRISVRINSQVTSRNAWYLPATWQAEYLSSPFYGGNDKA